MNDPDDRWADPGQPGYRPAPPMGDDFYRTIGEYCQQENAKAAGLDPAYLPDRSPDPCQMTAASGIEPGFPAGFQGPGPMFAAVGLGDPWYDLAVRGATSYVVEVPGQDPEQVDGWAFLDRGQAEAVADAVADGELVRYEGLCGWSEQTPARRLDEADAVAAFYGLASGAELQASHDAYAAQVARDTEIEDRIEAEAERGAEAGS